VIGAGGVGRQPIVSRVHPAGLVALVRSLWRAGHRRNGEVRSSGGIEDALRRRMEELRLAFVPFGDGDHKTGSPGSYREVGATCPPTCRYLGNGCYAEGGNVALHQRGTGDDVQAALHGAAAVLVWAGLTGRTARLHVAGDLGMQVDPHYVDGLCAIGREVRRLTGNAVVAWTYTHHADGPYRAALADAGIVVRLSDRVGASGAVVVESRDHARRLRATTGAPVAVCPAQLRDVNCAACRLCWTRLDVTIAFLSHGVAKAKVNRVIRETA
jgi:hypothetical protein